MTLGVCPVLLLKSNFSSAKVEELRSVSASSRNCWKRNIINQMTNASKDRKKQSYVWVLVPAPLPLRRCSALLLILLLGASVPVISVVPLMLFQLLRIGRLVRLEGDPLGSLLRLRERGRGSADQHVKSGMKQTLNTMNVVKGI